MYLAKNDILMITLAESLTALVFLNKSLIILALSAAPIVLAQASPFILFSIILITSISSLSRTPSKRTKSPQEKFSKALKLSILSIALLSTLILFNLSSLVAIGGILYSTLLIIAGPATFSAYLAIKYINMKNEISKHQENSGSSINKGELTTNPIPDNKDIELANIEGEISKHQENSGSSINKGKLTTNPIPDNKDIVLASIEGKTFETPQSITHLGLSDSVETLPAMPWKHESPASTDKTFDMYDQYSKPSSSIAKSSSSTLKGAIITKVAKEEEIDKEITTSKKQYKQKPKFNIYSTTKLIFLWLLAISTTTLIVDNTAHAIKPIEIKEPIPKHSPRRGILGIFRRHKNMENNKPKKTI
jgi:hypothetical protein